MRPIRTFVSEYVHPSHSVSTHPVGSTIIAIGWDEHIRIDDVRSGGEITEYAWTHTREGEITSRGHGGATDVFGYLNTTSAVKESG